MKTYIIIILTVFCLAGCGSVKTASVANREKTHIEYRDRLQTDSVFVLLRDSIFVHGRNDTVFVEKFKTQTLYRDRLRVDTVSITDTVQITRLETITETINRLNGLQWFQIWIGRIVLILIAVYLLIKRYLK